MKGRVLPTGTVTFLFSDMEGSTRLVQEHGPAAFTQILERHNEILRAAFRAHGGTERGTQGDSFLVMFAEAPAALAAAAEVQTVLASAAWPGGAAVRVRMGLHTGIGTLGGDDYVGLDVNRAARIAAAARGGQVLLSDATRALTQDSLPAGASLRDLGEHKLRDLARPEHLFQLVLAGVPSDFAPIGPSDAGTGGLPARLTTFLGRERELAELGPLLDANRLVTLTGPGGTGKTSLAIELARSRAASSSNGVWFVPLESVRDFGLVDTTIAATLGLISSPGVSTMERLSHFLEGRRVLLVIDNFEQVLDAAPLLGELLQVAPGLRLLVTSRAPLRLSIEQEYPVAPLAVPGPVDPIAAALESPAVRLFVERAGRVRPGYALTAADAPAIAEICTRLDGLPLGIELAASRIGLMPARSIAERLARRLDLPGGGPRDVPERQRSLERAIAWSYDLLEPRERRLLAQLSLFSGGCRLEEAEAVCGPAVDLDGDVIDGLSALVDHSLVQPVPGPDGVRYRLLETVRLFARDRLADEPDRQAVERRHAHAYLALAEEAARHMPARDQMLWLDRLKADHDNLRDAVRWAVAAGDVEVALRLAGALWRFWQLRGHMHEGLATMAEVLAMPGAELPTEARVRALEAAGGLKWWSADIAAADGFYAEALELSRTLGDPRGIADALFNLGHTRFVLGGDRESVEAMRREAIDLYRRLGDERGVARARWLEGYAILRWGNPAEARALMLELLPTFQEFDDVFYVALVSLSLSGIALGMGDIRTAVVSGVESLRSQLAMGDIASTILGLRGAALVLASAGLPADGALMNGAFDALCRRYGFRPPANPEDWASLGWTTEEALAALRSEGAYADEWQRGSTMSLEEAVDHLFRVVAEGFGEESAELPAPAAASDRTPAAASDPPPAVGRFIREGDVWAVTFEERTIRLRDSKGLRHLARLLASPGREIPAIELAADLAAGAERVAPGQAADAGLTPTGPPDDPLLDREAREAYRDRLRDLQAEIDEAERFGDAGRASRYREEFQVLTRELAIATGLGGRQRGAPSSAERARQAVSKATRQALDRIAEQDAALGAHLRHSVRTGVMCGYLPDPRSEVRWIT
jgi:predicted ATPase/class 3 adenylate cyclase